MVCPPLGYCFWYCFDGHHSAVPPSKCLCNTCRNPSFKHARTPKPFRMEVTRQGCGTSTEHRRTSFILVITCFFHSCLCGHCLLFQSCGWYVYRLIGLLNFFLLVRWGVLGRLPTSDVDIVVQGAGSNRFQKRKPTTSKGSSNGNHPKHGHKAEQGEGRVVDARTPEECLATAWEAFQRIYALLSCQPWAENVKGKVHTFRCRYT